jgi:hypothetical protein
LGFKIAVSGETVTDSGSLNIERVGGLAGVGLPGSRIRSQGEVDLATLPPEDQKIVDLLFTSQHSSAPGVADGFRYRLTRNTPSGNQTVEVPEHLVPSVVASAVKDELV